MKQFWVDSCIALSQQKAEFYSGARKIHRRVRLLYIGNPMDLTPVKKQCLDMADCGFTKSKTSMLMRNYFVPESVVAAKMLWARRLEQEKYGSVGFSCYGHYVKGGGLRNPWEISQAKKSGKPHRASVMGPCIQGVTLTLTKKGSTSVDVFYRTTELYKKWPADLVFLRDNLLSSFDFSGAPIHDVACHFGNVTCHPMYWITLVPHLQDPIETLEKLRRMDLFFYNWVLKWSARYICPEHHRGIAKFAQALRVGMVAKRDIDKETLRDLQKYFRKNHPGHRNDYDEEGEDE